MALLAAKPTDVSAGPGMAAAPTGRTVGGLPSLDERIEMFARMVFGPDVTVTPEIRTLARDHILTAMAADLVDKTAAAAPARQRPDRFAAQIQSAKSRSAISDEAARLSGGVGHRLQGLIAAAAAPFTLRRLGIAAVPLVVLLVAGSVLTQNWRNGTTPAAQDSTANAPKTRSLETQPADTVAEQNLQRAIAAEEAAHGRSDPAVARKLVDLASLFQADHRYAEAQALCERALIIQDQALGPNNPETLRTIKELAGIYRAEGRLREADQLLTRLNQP